MKTTILILIASALIFNISSANPNEKKSTEKVKITNKKMKKRNSFTAKNVTKLSDKININASDVNTIYKKKVSSPQAKNQSPFLGDIDTRTVSNKTKEKINSPHFKNKKHFR